MDIWTQVCNSEVRGFDEPGRWLQQPATERAEFTSQLLRAVSELSAWAAMETCDLDDPDARDQLWKYLAAMEQLLSVLRVGAAEAMARGGER